MLAHLSPPLGISILKKATLLIPHPSAKPAREHDGDLRAAPPHALGYRVTREDLGNLPTRVPHGPKNGLIPPHALEVRYQSLWHGLLASPGRPGIPDSEGFHPGTTPAFPRQLMIHPAVHYLRRDVLYFPYLRCGSFDYLLCLPYRGRAHTPFLIGIDGLIVPYVYVSEESPVTPMFPGDAARCCGVGS